MVKRNTTVIYRPKYFLVQGKEIDSEKINVASSQPAVCLHTVQSTTHRSRRYEMTHSSFACCLDGRASSFPPFLPFLSP
jgi:hypothetical protein